MFTIQKMIATNIARNEPTTIYRGGYRHVTVYADGDAVTIDGYHRRDDKQPAVTVTVTTDDGTPNYEYVATIAERILGNVLPHLEEDAA